MKRINEDIIWQQQTIVFHRRLILIGEDSARRPESYDPERVLLEVAFIELFCSVVCLW